MKLAARLGNLESRVAAMPRPVAPGPMSLAGAIDCYPDLVPLFDYLMQRIMGQMTEPPPWADVTPDTCRQLIEAVPVEDAKAAAEGRPLPSTGIMGLMAQHARVVKEQLEREAARTVDSVGGAA